MIYQTKLTDPLNLREQEALRGTYLTRPLGASGQ